MTPTIITLTGPTCAGKSHLEKQLVAAGCAALVSTTTRVPRFGEADGKSYYFVSREDFARLHASGAFIESVEFNGNRYGATVAEVERVTAQGKPVVIVCEPNGRDQIAKHCRANGWNLLRVYVGNPEAVIAERFLERYTQDLVRSLVPEKVREQYIQRMASIMGAERGWVQEAGNQMVSGGDDPYDMLLTRYDAENLDDVMFSITHTINAMLGEDPELEIAA